MAANQGIEIQTKVTGLSQAEKLARALDMVAKHSEKVGKQRTAQYFNQNEKAISRVNREMQRNLVLQQQSGKSTRRMELGFQQAGYQFQDLVVQLQGGVNPFVAISQQGSQLASFFAGPWGASIGLGIAALGALGTSMMAARGETKSLQQSISGLKETEQVVRDLAEVFDLDLANALDVVDEKFRVILETYNRLQLQSSIKALKKEIGGIDGFMSVAESLAGGMFATDEESGKFIGGSQQFKDRVAEVQGILAQLDDASIKTKDQLDQMFVKVITDLDKLSYVEQDYIDRLIQIAGGDLQAIQDIAQNLVDEQEDKNDALEIEAKLTEKLLGLQQDRDLDAKKALADLLKQQGQLVQAERLEKEIAAEILTNKAMQLAEGKALTSEQQKSLNAAIRSAQEAIELKYELGQAKDEATDLAKALAKAEAALNSMKNFGNGLETALAKAKAEAVALATGADVATAKAIAGFRSQQGQKIDKMVEAGVDQSLIDAEKQRSTSLINELETVLAENAAETKRQRDAAKSGRKATSDQQKFNDYIASQERELELKIKNFGLTEEIIKRNEYEFKIKEKAASLGVEATDKQMKAVMELYDKTAQLEKLQPYIDAFEDGLTDAFTAVVDGTKSVEDAFKGMLRTIILEIYKQEVASSAAKGISGFIKGLFQADGGVHSRGLVTPFANGGIVGGPTLFPMANGVGLMGEAGPEAIMPLKRGSDGKLGVEGGGGTTVVQNINISTGVQQTVRTEIRQMMPQIAESAKSAVLDSKRRGGNYGRALA